MAYFDDLSKSGEPYVVTKRGVPLAKVIPYTEETYRRPDRLESYLVEEDDVVSPLGESDWNAAK